MRQCRNLLFVYVTLQDGAGSDSEYYEVSALHETGLDDLRHVIEDGLLKTTGRQIKTLTIPQDGPQLRYGHFISKNKQAKTYLKSLRNNQYIQSKNTLLKFNQFQMNIIG